VRACSRVYVWLYVILNWWYIMWRHHITLPVLRRTNSMQHCPLVNTASSSREISCICWNPKFN
jgi:hypothetical protein